MSASLLFLLMEGVALQDDRLIPSLVAYLLVELLLVLLHRLVLARLARGVLPPARRPLPRDEAGALTRLLVG